MRITDKIKNISFSQMILYLSLFFVGIFYEYLSSVLSVVLLVWLTVRLIKTGKLKVEMSVTFIAVSVLVISYAVTSIWALDRGTAIFGFFKFLPLFLYTLVLMQDGDGKEKVIFGLPYVITAMTVLSVIGMYIPIISNYFKVSERLSGFFQYPNTFALVILVAELLLLTRARVSIPDYVCMVVLLFGILYTGSRTVLILAIVSNIAALLINKNKKVRWITLICIVLGVVAALVYCFVTDNFWVLERYFKISFSESTFVGRILYATDALPVILNNPFGIGSKGYHYIQQSIQTGAYSVMYIHNDFLQIMLDVGWIPCLAFVGAMVKTLFSKNVSLSHKLVLCVMLVHSLFDFNLQYVAVFMILLLFTDLKPFKSVVLEKQRGTVVVFSVLLILLCSYMAVGQGMIRFGLYRVADAVYPYSTQCEIELLKECEDMEELDELADSIIKRNSYVSVAYSAKSRVAYAQGDFEKVMEYKNKAIELAPLVSEEYREYAYMLINGIALYTQAGDDYSTEVCKDELFSLVDKLEAARAKVSELGAGIDTQPNLKFPLEIEEYLDRLEAEMK